MKERILFFILALTIAVSAGLFNPITTMALYPEKPVNIICPYSAGGSVDMTARAIAEAVKKYFPQPMVVINRGGGGGTIGTAEAIHANPDGYTIGISSNAVLTVQPHRTKLPFRSPDDYTPIIKLVNNSIILPVKTEVPWKNIQEFIEYVRVTPGKVRVGHSGIGTFQQINIDRLKLMAKIDFTSVPFSGGAEALLNLLGGHVEAIAITTGEIVPHVKAGKVRGLAIFDEKRNPNFPEVPTFKEIGYDITVGSYYLIIGPKDLSPQIVSFLHDSFKQAMKEPVFINAMELGGSDVSYEGSQDIKKRLWRDYETNAKFVEILGLKGK